jgi:hypothetical protein
MFPERTEGTMVRVVISTSDNDLLTANCPRCGYDQRGVIATWEESCPLAGVCTECGLEFVWCEVLRPEKFEPRWCIEFEPRVRRLPLAALRTYFRSFVPWQFWSRLKMSDAIHWRRLALYVALLLAVPVLTAYAPIQVALATYARVQVQQQLAQSVQVRPTMIQNLQASARQLAAMPLTGDAWNDTQIKAQVASINAELARQQALGTSQEMIDSSWLYTTWEALVKPLSGRSGASVVSSSGVRSWPYFAPRDLWQFVAMWSGGTVSSRALMNGLALPLGWLAWGLAMTFMLPLSFVLMPLSMRKAKVRWAHIIRVTAYSLFIPLACLWLTAITFLAVGVLAADSLLELYASAVRYAPWLAVALWWQAATSRYLKIPHAWLTIGMLTLMCLLILLAITAAISQELAWEMLDLFDPLIR